jgi:hypothetical protein
VEERRILKRKNWEREGNSEREGEFFFKMGEEEEQ